MTLTTGLLHHCSVPYYPVRGLYDLAKVLHHMQDDRWVKVKLEI